MLTALSSVFRPQAMLFMPQMVKNVPDLDGNQHFSTRPRLRLSESNANSTAAEAKKLGNVCSPSDINTIITIIPFFSLRTFFCFHVWLCDSYFNTCEVDVSSRCVLMCCWNPVKLVVTSPTHLPESSPPASASTGSTLHQCRFQGNHTCLW